jgi:Rieske Fe-S protein
MKVTRRELLKGAAATTTLVAVGCGNDVTPAPILPEAVTVTNGTLVLDVSRYPDLAPIGGAITVPVANAAATGLPEALLVVHRDPSGDMQYIAVNSHCPHAGCPLGYNPKAQLIECPCHASLFSAGLDGPVGAVLHLPAPTSASAYPVTLVGTILTIKIGGCNAMVPFAMHPELMNPGGFVVVQPPEIECPLVVVRKDANTAVAFDAHCTHQQCVVLADPANNRLNCPCHGSQFDLSGNVLNPPATRPLAMLPATVEADGIKVG